VVGLPRRILRGLSYQCPPCAGSLVRIFVTFLVSVVLSATQASGVGGKVRVTVCAARYSIRGLILRRLMICKF